jgi:uncharacterized protein involved in response to NO
MSIQPYQLFFFLGVVYGIWGVLLWPLYSLGWVGYPGPFHIQLMSGGFVQNFIAGFMLTAVPRFTGSRSAQKAELLICFLLSLWPFLVLLGAPLPFTPTVFSFLQVSFLLFFFLKRYFGGHGLMPENFKWIGLGLLFGIVGGALSFANHAYESSLLINQGMILSVIIGVGSRIVAALMGWQPQEVKSKKMILRTRLQMLLFSVGLGFEIFGWIVPGRFLRAFVVAYAGYHDWRLYRWPARFGYQSILLWCSAWALILGLFAYALAPTLSIHALHLTFVSGYSLVILLIATRVSLAHGGYDLSLETHSKMILAAGVFVFIAAATRVSAFFIPSSYFNHLTYAAVAWLSGVLIWSFLVVPRIFLLRSGRAPDVH